MREAISDFIWQGMAWSGQGLELGLVVIVAVGLADEVQDCQAILARAEAEAPAQLLEEDGRALGWPQEKDGVDGWDVDPSL